MPTHIHIWSGTSTDVCIKPKYFTQQAPLETTPFDRIWNSKFKMERPSPNAGHRANRNWKYSNPFQIWSTSNTAYSIDLIFGFVAFNLSITILIAVKLLRITECLSVYGTSYSEHSAVGMDQYGPIGTQSTQSSIACIQWNWVLPSLTGFGSTY